MKALVAWMLSLIFIHNSICDAFALWVKPHALEWDQANEKIWKEKTSAKQIASVAEG